MKNFQPNVPKQDSKYLLTSMIVSVIILVLLILWVLLPIPIHAESGRDVTILGVDERSPNDGRVIQPHLPPIIGIRQVSGPVLPKKGSVSCTWKQQNDVAGTPRVFGFCENDVVVVITGIDLNH